MGQGHGARGEIPLMAAIPDGADNPLQQLIGTPDRFGIGARRKREQHRYMLGDHPLGQRKFVCAAGIQIRQRHRQGGSPAGRRRKPPRADAFRVRDPVP